MYHFDDVLYIFIDVLPIAGGAVGGVVVILLLIVVVIVLVVCMR